MIGAFFKWLWDNFWTLMVLCVATFATVILTLTDWVVTMAEWLWAHLLALLPATITDEIDWITSYLNTTEIKTTAAYVLGALDVLINVDLVFAIAFAYIVVFFISLGVFFIMKVKSFVWATGT